MTAPLPLGRVVATPGALKLLSEASEDLWVWIITEADRSVTTILLPEDY
jgi:hypothetical protein